VRLLNQYYGKQLSFNTDFDERYFIDINGLSRTPLKLINSMSPSYRKSPPSRGENSSNGTYKRPKKDIDLSFGSADPNFTNFFDKENKQDDHAQVVPLLQPPRQAMQRKLNFTSSLHEISLRQSLSLNYQ
jgi:hypothetical protein